MAKQTINIGSSPNDGTGTPLRTAFDYTNQNFTELYTATGPSGNNIVVPGTATITGDLTVDTSTLKVDSTNNRVGIGTASPASILHISGTTSSPRIEATSNGTGSTLRFIGKTNAGVTTDFEQGINLANQNSFELYDNVNGQVATRYVNTGTHNWFITGTTAMTLNSTGLGVGTAPANGIKLASYVTTAGVPATSGTTQSAGSLRIGAASTAGVMDMGTNGSYSWIQPCNATNLATNYDLVLNPNGGNVGIGVTPSAWNSSYRGLQLGAGGAISAHTSASLPWLVATSNSFINSAGDWKFINNGYSTRYLARGDDGTQSWWTSNNGSAGGTVSFTQAMTLDASGNLVVGKSSISATTVGFEGRANGTVNSTLASSVDANATYAAYSTGAAAYRFYVGMGGTVYATNTTISAISDARLKENVQDIDVGLGAILALKPRKFDWKAGKGKDIKGDRGFIAQEFETVFPQLVDEWKDEAPEGEAPYKSVRQDLIPVLVKAIQELTARVQTLEAK